MIRANIEVVQALKKPNERDSYSSLHVSKGLLEIIIFQINLKELSVPRSKGGQENKEIFQID